jgi:hypothetical protein
MSCKLAEKLSDIFSFDMLTGPYQPVVDKIEDEHIRKIRVSLKKNKDLIINKTRLIQTVSEFESSCRYAGHITLNVDPI